MLFCDASLLKISPADYFSLVFYIFYLSITNNFFIFLGVSVVADYSMDRVEEGKVREMYVLTIIKSILILIMELVICWSTFHYFFILGRGMGNLPEMLLVD
jgi:hypothetical protein